MLIFHEGLPRSGKSYSACVDHIIPALKSGRRVYCCIAGVDYQKFADVCNLELEECKALLIQLKPDDLNAQGLPLLWDKFPSGKMVQSDYDGEIAGSMLQDSLLIIDEIQNLYQPGRTALPEGVMRFIAEHGHYGMDVVIMSQSWSSVHKGWRARVQRKYIFTKLTAVGMDHKFKTEAWEAVAPEKFEKISSEVKKYDPLYFGLYRSHVDGTKNTANLQDDRINIFKGSFFRFGVPGFAVVFALAVMFISHFFTSGITPKKVKPPIVQAKQTEQVMASVQPDSSKLLAKKPIDEPKLPPPPIDYFDALARSGKIRLSGYIKIPGREYNIVEVVDKAGHDSEIFYSDHLQAMGWKVERFVYGVVVSQGATRYVARSWPRNPWGKITRDQSMALQ